MLRLCLVSFFAVRSAPLADEEWGDRSVLPTLTLVDNNRFAAFDANASAWCPETPWPEGSAGSRRVVLVLRGEMFRSEATTYSAKDGYASTSPCSSEAWVEPQLSTARMIVNAIVVPLQSRGLAVDVLAAPSNPGCQYADRLYDVLESHNGSRPVVRVAKESKNQGQGVQNALEALRARASDVKYEAAMFLRFDGKPLADAAELIFARGPEKLLVDIIGHTRMTEIAHVDHAYWFPWPALSCFYAVVHNNWPRLPERCMLGGDQVTGDECVRVKCFEDGVGDGHPCLEALQERVRGWESRVDTFQGRYALREFHDLPSPQTLKMENWDERWWRFTRESVTGDVIVAPQSVPVDDWAEWAVRTEQDDAAWWAELNANLERVRAAHGAKQAQARARQAAAAGKEL